MTRYFSEHFPIYMNREEISLVWQAYGMLHIIPTRDVWDPLTHSLFKYRSHGRYSVEFDCLKINVRWSIVYMGDSWLNGVNRHVAACYVCRRSMFTVDGSHLAALYLY